MSAEITFVGLRKPETQSLASIWPVTSRDLRRIQGDHLPPMPRPPTVSERLANLPIGAGLVIYSAPKPNHYLSRAHQLDPSARFDVRPSGEGRWVVERTA